LGNIGNLKKSFLHCQTYAAFTFSEDSERGFNSPDNNAGFYAETAATNEIQDTQRRFKNEMLSAAGCKTGEYIYFGR
jgi:hypothetical protein